MGNIIKEKSLEFWIKISKFYLNLKDKKYFEIASQLFRSGTSVWANISEAQQAVSRKDFLNKIWISLKEAQETEYWLEILDKWFKENVFDLQNDCQEIIKILVVIVKNTKNNGI